MTRKPGASFTTTGVFPIFLARSKIVAVTSGAVFSPKMTSTSGILWTGLKKCIPTTRSGREAAFAISVIGSVEVFEAKIASGFATASHSFRTACLTASFSRTASIVTSQASKPSQPRPPERSDIFEASSVRVIRRRFTRSCQIFAACA